MLMTWMLNVGMADWTESDATLSGIEVVGPTLLLAWSDALPETAEPTM